MEQQCPGLPDRQALIDCHEKFATPDTFPDGRFLAYPADWGHRSADIIKETGIPFQAVPAGSEGALVAELKSAYERKAPIIMMFWAPHWVLSTVDYGWIKMPEDIAKKYNLLQVPIWKMASTDFQSTWPAAYRLLQHYQIHNDEQQKMMDLIDNQGQDLDKVTQAWVDQHEDVWKPWVDAAMAGS
jgi:glycine betaine/proline transport system substrate-binding protein